MVAMEKGNDSEPADYGGDEPAVFEMVFSELLQR